MEEKGDLAGELPSLPPRIFERLAQLSGYSWDQSIQPFHSSYDNWHVFGIRHIVRDASSGATSRDASNSSRTDSSRSSPQLGSRPSLRHHETGMSDAASDASNARTDPERTYIPVVARLSTHALRIEREYHLCRSMIQTSDPDCKHTVRPVDLIRLSAQQGDSGTIIVSIFESPGRNYLKELVDFGPAWLRLGSQDTQRHTDVLGTTLGPRDQISLTTFLNFAIGATECLELLHHGLRAVHGELRADAFHFNHETGAVKLINFGSGPRSFENGLTSAGWLSLSREVGVKNKLQFIAPEQTGRMPAEPDSRTDIYSLGVLFWTMLTLEPAFMGDTPIDIVQGVLGRRIPPVASKRMDVPDVLSCIIQKMTQKQIDERYHSTSGLKHDLIEIQRILRDGDGEALKSFPIGTKDVSSFFILPTAIFGRSTEHAKIVSIIEKVGRRQEATALHESAGGLHSLTSGSSTSDGHVESFGNVGGSSDTSSQVANDRSNSAPVAGPAFLGSLPNGKRDSAESVETTVPVTAPSLLEPGDSKESTGNTSTIDSLGEGINSMSAVGTNGIHSESLMVTRPQGSQRYRRKGRCEVIRIVGAAGLGKSSLIQNVQGEIRRQGYFASAKFDQAKKAPFEPVLRVMSSLFRQIFSESNVDTDYHNMIRSNLRGIWPSLCSMLDLPEKLIYLGSQHAGKANAARSYQGLNKSIRAEMRDSSSSHSSISSSNGGQSSVALLRTGVSSQSLRFTNTFLEVLRVLTRGKLICLCLDDLQFADEESLDLLASIIAGKLRTVLIVTCREEEALPAKIKTVLDGGDANVTILQLAPLSEADVIDYVAATLYRPQEYVFPLAAVCMEKTNGNPFYLRQMLEVCHRKKCLWYSWKHSMWEYDLDRVFAEFETEIYGQQLNTNFITKRLQDLLPPAARSILAWASLLGGIFSFALVERLLSGEFDYAEENRGDEIGTRVKKAEIFMPQPTKHVVEGLQACLQAYILVPGEDDDQFRFSHDRYIQASASLRESHDVEKMHFIIAQTMMKYSNLDDRSLYTRARHICQAAGLIKRRIDYRSRFRQLLFEAAGKAIETGARPTGLWYYENCLHLLQPDPWKEGAHDVYYEETLDLYTKAAELYWYQGRSSEALNLLTSTFARARIAADKAPSWILQSRVLAQRGDSLGAFNALKTSLNELGLDFEKGTTWEVCDQEYENLHQELQTTDIGDIVQKQLSMDPDIVAMGAVLVEAMSAAFWSDALLFYQMLIKMISVYLDHGTFVQVGLGFSHFATIGMSRFADMAFGLRMYSAGLQLLRRFNDPYTLGRGLTTSTLFVAHLVTPIRDHLATLVEAIDHTLAAGDKILFLIAIGSLAISRLYLGFDMAEIESFCMYAPEDFGDWTSDLRGGLILTAVRQVARSLQGKTRSDKASTVMTDEDHDTKKYMEFICAHASNVERPRDIYNSLAMIPLYIFGHYDEAISTGDKILESMDEFWTIRNSRLVIFYLSLAMLARLRESPSNLNSTRVISKVREYKHKIEEWQAECDVNYLMWSLLIEAEICEMTGDFHSAIQAYEAAIDHTQVHGFALEEALALELQGGFFSRRGAKRAARATLEDAIAAYVRISASGKVEQLATKHEWVLKTATRSRCVDVAIQTANSIGDIGNTQYRIEENERQEVRNLGKESAGDRTQAWLTPNVKIQDQGGDADVSTLGLDVLDLQSILEFNQAISSELQIDRLLAKMTEIILESAGAQADYAGVVVEAEDGGWCIAASGTQDGITSEARPLTEVQDVTATQVIFYTLRLKEPVFVHNITNDVRFSPNAPSAKSVISLPIVQGNQLLGVLYLEGQAHSFTTRNLGVLRLFCNQVGISIANALLFRKVKKASESQKRALTKAREAENKAKLAEAEAIRNVRLKEEAAKAKSMFLANVSHELRTPLNGVIGMSELLKGTALNEEQESYADSIRVCADTLLTVINDILDFSKLEAGKMKLFSVPLNLRETITEVVRALSYTNLERGLQTIEDFDLDPHLLVIGDPVRLHQILMNLLSNAYKFTEKGSVTVRARTDSEDDQSITVTCQVADTGIGITQEQSSRLFTPFSQADSSTQRSYGGSGLGLSICKALIGVLDGKIWLESQIGVGTTVSFTLTFAKAPEEAVPTTALISAQDPDPMATWSSDTEELTPSLPVETFIDLSKIPRDELRICIAEDNPINQKIAVSFVTKLGFKSEAYSDGKQAVEALRQRSREKRPFHLVLMDVQMPVMDGYDATRLIREDQDPAVRGVLIIAMTASAIRGDKERCLHAGMNNYLAKPVRAAVLKTMLEGYLSQSVKPIPDLEKEANDLAKHAIEEVEHDRVPSSDRPGVKARHSSRVASKVSNGVPSSPLPTDVLPPNAMPVRTAGNVSRPRNTPEANGEPKRTRTAIFSADHGKQPVDLPLQSVNAHGKPREKPS